MFRLAFIAAFLVPVSAHALCVVQTSQTADETCLNLGNGFVCESLTDLGSPGNLNKQAVELGNRLQARIDQRLLRTTLVFDEPNKNTDPKTDREFWSSIDGDPEPDTGDYITSRCAAVTVDVIDGQFRVGYTRTN